MIDPFFAHRLLAWWDEHGRKDLPWQQERSPLPVWVAEVMLQQTQVAVVVRYFERFMARFPNIHALASASLDDVLHLWSGLGYYGRAHNLHRAAAAVVRNYDGILPNDQRVLMELPASGVPPPRDRGPGIRRAGRHPRRERQARTGAAAQSRRRGDTGRQSVVEARGITHAS